MNDEVRNPVPPVQRSSFRLHRSAFSLAAAVSLLLCLATIALWVRSYWSGDQITRIQDHPHQIMLQSARGQFLIAWLDWHRQDVVEEKGWRCRSFVPKNASFPLFGISTFVGAP